MQPYDISKPVPQCSSTEIKKEILLILSQATQCHTENNQNRTENDSTTEMLKDVSSLSNANLDSDENDQDRTENDPPASFRRYDATENDQNRTEDDHSPENEMLKQVFGDDLLTSSGQEIEKIGKTYNRGKNPNILSGNKDEEDEESAEQIINSEEINEHLKSVSKEFTDVSTTAENSEMKDIEQNISSPNTNQ